MNLYKKTYTSSKSKHTYLLKNNHHTYIYLIKYKAKQRKEKSSSSLLYLHIGLTRSLLVATCENHDLVQVAVVHVVVSQRGHAQLGSIEESDVKV